MNVGHPHGSRIGSSPEAPIPALAFPLAGAITSEETHLEELLKSKQESLRILQQHNREKESKMLRKQAMAQDSLQKITELNSKIQEDKVKKKKLRMEFEQQLEELMEQHKTLWELHTPERLSQEINTMASTKEQLLKEERLVREKLEAIEKELARLPQDKQVRAKALDLNSVNAFLCSEEAATALYLFEEENKRAKWLLEASLGQYNELWQKYHRLKMELEAVGQSVIRGPKGSVPEAAAEGAPGEPVVEPPGAWEKEQNMDLSPGEKATG
ncbi:synaptonemal complex central element protein 1 isoform X2 [Monodelphis domestica]|uniref:synaptonemal complex central element protein 1 isoform X2 n=1 Tax=Monodelphis domestica TaxID=13616 RepID=UPI0024E25F4C|nr:synaptonemal complex central element protein 1 isoform X2 [Monodelphis domestica]